MGGILQVGDPVRCDGCRHVGGECGVDLGAEAEFDVSVLRLG